MKGAVQPWNRRKLGITAGVIVLVALVANHLTAPEYFPTHPDYAFPWANVIFTVLATPFILGLSTGVFRWFRAHRFEQEVNSANVTLFLLTVLGILSLLYIGSYYGLTGAFGVETDLKNLLTGWMVSLLMTVIGLALLFAQPLYALYRASLNTGTLRVQSGRRTAFVRYEDIAYFVSQQKLVYLVKSTGESLITEFTLGELENRLPTENFFRANRQALLHRQGVSSIASEANGKLCVQLSVSFQALDSLTISRYKAKELKQWLAVG